VAGEKQNTIYLQISGAKDVSSPISFMIKGKYQRATERKDRR
jgi:hypothetical protein